MIRARLRQQSGSFRLDVRFDVPGGVTALCGPSGSGKTTAIELLLGLRRLDEGEVLWNDTPLERAPGGPRLPPERRRFGAVFQDGLLFPHLTVGQNIRFGLSRRSDGDQEETLGKWIRLLQLTELLDRRPRFLSGGEKRRVALARALATRPRALLLDEPLTGLDGKLKREVLLALRRLKRAASLPILFVSHQPAEVLAFADRVVRLEDGRVQWEGEPARLLAEADGLGTDEPINFIDARVEAVRPDGLTELMWGTHRLLAMLESAVPGDQVTLSIRPSDVLLALGGVDQVSASNRIQLQIHTLLTIGPWVWVRFIAPDPFLVLVTRRAREELSLQEGQTVTLLIKSLGVTA